MAFSAEHLTKRFFGTTVLKDVTFSMQSGEVVALLGQNGSGKSTLIKILTGYHAPDDPAAALVIEGERRPWPWITRQSHGFTIGAVHQDLGLVQSATVAENLLLTSSRGHALNPIRWSRLYAEATAALDRIGAANLSPRAVVKDLPALQQAAIAIARAVHQIEPGGLLVLDEVTAFLTQDGVRELFDLVAQVSRAGVSVLFVSHRLEEIWQVCSRALVLRGGELVEDVELSTTSNAELIDAIVGQPLEWLYPPKQEVTGPVRLRLSVAPDETSGGLDIEARAGEILGVTGLRGMGYEQVVRVLYGERPRSGTLQIDDDVAELSRFNPFRAYGMGIRLVPSERLKNGAFRMGSVAENASLPVLGQFMRYGILRRRLETDWVEDLIARYGIVPEDAEMTFGSLSGGNQQKVVVGHWLETRPRALLLDEPVQGVDIGARRDIFARIVESAKNGMTIIYASSEASDLAELCHRVLVFRNGQVSGTLEGPAVTEHQISLMSWAVTASAAG